MLDLKALLTKILQEKVKKQVTVNGTSGNFILYRVGNFVYFKAAFATKTSAVASGTTLPQSIPNGYRPISDAYVPIVTLTATNGRLGCMTNGNITYFGNASLAANATIYASATWLTTNDYPS